MRKERKYLPRLCCFNFYVKYFVLFHGRNSYFLVFIQTFFESYGSSLFLE